MQVKNLELRKKKIWVLPIIDYYLEKIGLSKILSEFIKHQRYIDSIELLVKNFMVDRNPLYRINEWASQFDPELVNGGGINDDVLARALGSLFEADRASIQTRLVLESNNSFNVKFDNIHNDSTTIKFYGAYKAQNSKAVQLKRGHSKDHRHDLKQIIYNLCVSDDGAVPVHFKTCNGNRTDDTLHWDTWLSLRGLFNKSDFLYVADSKLCTKENMHRIDSNQGRFITVVPDTRGETREFAELVYQSAVRWKEILRKKSTRHKDKFDVYQLAEGLFQLNEGYVIHWYRSSEKRKMDQEDREERIMTAIEKLSLVGKEKKRGRKTEKGILKAANNILSKCGASKWIQIEVKVEEQEVFKKTSPGKPNKDSKYRRTIKKVPVLIFRKDKDSIARSKAMDGIFPLTTNTSIKAVEVLKHYKYQPYVEKRHSLLKSVLEVASVYLKKNERIEAFMFVYFIAQLVTALIERDIRLEMKNKGIEKIKILPEQRPTGTPTWEQICRIFENIFHYELYSGKKILKTFSDDLSPNQLVVLDLLKIPKNKFYLS